MDSYKLYMSKQLEFDMELANMIMSKDAELRLEFRKQLGLMSYYNAAEGEYSNEKVKRNECRDKLILLASLLRANGASEMSIIEATKDFMVSKSDFTPSEV